MDADFGPITRVFVVQVSHFKITVIILANREDLDLLPLERFLYLLWWWLFMIRFLKCIFCIYKIFIILFSKKQA